MDRARLFDQITKTALASHDADLAWQEVLIIVGEDQRELAAAQPSNDVASLVGLLERVFNIETPPATLSLLYFGLFEGAKEETVLYVSGSSCPNHEEALGENKLDYFPECRFLKSSLLQSVDKAKSSTKMNVSAYEYLLQFGAAAVVVKSAADRMSLRVPVYVGFDSGDYAKIRA